jgi:hypothetical protein
MPPLESGGSPPLGSPTSPFVHTLRDTAHADPGSLDHGLASLDLRVGLDPLIAQLGIRFGCVDRGAGRGKPPDDQSIADG